MTAAPRALRVLYYVQHLLGIGHLMRAGRIAHAMAGHGMAVTLVSGGVPVKGFDPVGVRQLSLPPLALGNGSFGELVDADGQAIDDAYWHRRSETLLQIFRDTRPDGVMLEAFPFGRRQVRFELLRLIEAIESTDPKPVLVSSVRDILQRRSKPGRDEASAALVRQHFDRVLVHGDPGFASFGESFSCAEAIADRILYTGLVCAPLPPATSQRFDIIVSAGGGAVGGRLVEKSFEAAACLSPELSWCVITGPNLSDTQFNTMVAQRTDNVTIERFRTDFPSLLRTAGVSVSQAGYNTMGDVMQSGCRAILVPFSAGGETEQADRAARLRQLGLARVIAEDELTGEALALSITRSLATEKSSVPPLLDTNGAVRTAEILEALMLESSRSSF